VKRSVEVLPQPPPIFYVTFFPSYFNHLYIISHTTVAAAAEAMRAEIRRSVAAAAAAAAAAEGADSKLTTATSTLEVVRAQLSTLFSRCFYSSHSHYIMFTILTRTCSSCTLSIIDVFAFATLIVSFVLLYISGAC
jgi:hypothetical protein